MAAHLPISRKAQNNPALSSRPSISETAPKDHFEIRIWLRLLASASRLESILQSRFTREFGISLARFDVLRNWNVPTMD